MVCALVKGITLQHTNTHTHAGRGGGVSKGSRQESLQGTVVTLSEIAKSGKRWKKTSGNLKGTIATSADYVNQTQACENV